jgi:hypothetical protein
MKRMKMTLICLILLINGFNAQSQFKDESYLKVSLGYSFLGAISDNPNFGILGPSKIQKFPSLKLDSRPLVLNLNDFLIYVNTGAGFAPTGYKYSYNSDTTYYYKESGMHIYAGLGIEYWGLAANGGNFPISLTVNGLYYTSIFSKSYINKELLDFDFMGSERLLGISSRLDIGVFDGNKVDLFVYVNYDRYFTDLSNYTANTLFKNHSLNFGITLQFVNGLYDTHFF